MKPNGTHGCCPWSIFRLLDGLINNYNDRLLPCHLSYRQSSCMAMHIQFASKEQYILYNIIMVNATSPSRRQAGVGRFINRGHPWLAFSVSVSLMHLLCENYWQIMCIKFHKYIHANTQVEVDSKPVTENLPIPSVLFYDSHTRTHTHINAPTHSSRHAQMHKHTHKLTLTRCPSDHVIVTIEIIY